VREQLPRGRNGAGKGSEFDRGMRLDIASGFEESVLQTSKKF
jgi:hypothetical protein